MRNNHDNNFLYLLNSINFLVNNYFFVFQNLFSQTVTLFFGVINTQVSSYFTVFNNLFIASLDTLRYLVDRHFILVENLMVKNKIENLVVLSTTVIILHLSHLVYQTQIHLHLHLNQADSVPLCQNSQNSRFPYLHHQQLLH